MKSRKDSRNFVRSLPKRGNSQKALTSSFEIPTCATYLTERLKDDERKKVLLALRNLHQFFSPLSEEEILWFLDTLSPLTFERVFGFSFPTSSSELKEQ